MQKEETDKQEKVVLHRQPMEITEHGIAVVAEVLGGKETLGMIGTCIDVN